MEKSNCHCTRVYWFSSSQCKIMHLKLASGAAHIYSLPVSPALLLGREGVKGFSNAKSSYSRGSWGGRCHLCDTGGWGQSTQPNNKDVILRPTPFSVTDFRCDILLFVLNEKAKEKTRPSSLLKALTSHPASAGLMLRAVKYLRESDVRQKLFRLSFGCSCWSQKELDLKTTTKKNPVDWKCSMYCCSRCSSGKKEPSSLWGKERESFFI